MNLSAVQEVNPSVNHAEARIIKSGSGTRLLNSGRLGLKHVGLGQNGAADMHAYLWANLLLGNSADSLAIETTLGQLQLRFDAPTQVSVTGALTDVRLNDEAMRPWSSFEVKKGDCIRLRIPSSGVYNYIAVKHGFSPDVKDRPLSDTILHYPSYVRPPSQRQKSCPWYHIPDYTQALPCRFIPSAQFLDFDERDRQRFIGSDYQIGIASNKMGARLQGPKLRYLGDSRYSQAVNLGTIQVPASGEPIVLLADHQTIGGYPKLGSVYACDSYQLAQRRPGQTLRFVPGTLEEAQRELTTLQQFFSGSLARTRWQY